MPVVASAVSARPATHALPGWLTLAPGTIARVDIAPWATADEPEAALAASPASLAGDATADPTRPGDVVYQAVGVRVRVVRLLAGGIALVHGVDRHFQAYTRVERLVPEIPSGTHVRAAGGFAGFAEFYHTLETPGAGALRLPTGSALIARETAAAPFDPASSDLIRVHVRVTTGALRGRSGWVAVAFTGLPGLPEHRPKRASEVACSCRLVQFDDMP